MLELQRRTGASTRLDLQRPVLALPRRLARHLHVHALALSRCAAHAWISSAAVCRFGRQEVETCWGAGHRSAALQFIEVRANPTCGAPHSALSVTSKLTG